MMFPTGVGMNRSYFRAGARNNNVPHRRGDEPGTRRPRVRTRRMFPTGVGMNRGKREGKMPVVDVPHRRGDEPQ